MEDVSKDKQYRYPGAQYAEDSKCGYSARLKSPCSLIAEVGSERQIEAGDCNEEETEENLLSLHGEHLPWNSDRPSRWHQSNANV